MELSDYFTLAFLVPENDAEGVRQAMARAGAGKLGNYSQCSFSIKGISRFLPNKGADPDIGKEGVLEEVVEEYIETVCKREDLEHVLEAIKKAHPYEETSINIFPIYEIGRKKAKKEEK